jgi:hypothetical protein
VIVGTGTQPEIAVPANADLTDVRLRLAKAGSTYTGSVSFDGGDTFVDMPKTVDNPMTAPRFGVFAAGVLQEGDEVSFDTFLVDGEDPVNAAPKAVDLLFRDGERVEGRESPSRPVTDGYAARRINLVPGAMGPRPKSV